MSYFIRAFGAQLPRTAKTLSVFDFLFSGQAILIYLFIIIVAVAILVFTLALSEPKGAKRSRGSR